MHFFPPNNPLDNDINNDTISVMVKLEEDAKEESIKTKGKQFIIQMLLDFFYW